MTGDLKMIHIWAKFENLINSILNKIIESTKIFVKNQTPDKIKGKISNTRDGLKEREKQFVKKSKDYVSQAKLKTQKSVVAIQEYDIKGKVIEKKEQSLTFIKALNFAKFVALLTAIVTLILKLLKKLTAKISPNFVIGTVVASGIAAVMGIQIYKSSQKIADESGTKEPTQIVQEMPAARPSWYKGVRKHIDISNLKLPIYISGSNSVKTLLMDFTLESSNRYIKIWIEENEHEVRDHILTTTEPILPEFPLSQEGKNVIKDKIKDEMNLYLKQKNIEGEIIKVNINRIIAG